MISLLCMSSAHCTPDIEDIASTVDIMQRGDAARAIIEQVKALIIQINPAQLTAQQLTTWIALLGIKIGN